MSTTDNTTDNNEPEYTGSATYCPEDNKLRLYVGRVPRDEYLKLRAEGWTSTPKQDCDFVAHWTPERRETALAYAGIIEDEDASPAERAADRAERFGGYREKRLGEACGHADRYDAGPSAHGYQSQARAERAASRHDRIGGRAVDAWDKAEYWQRRTAGVISHALHVSSPSVRMGRIKELESELRKLEKNAAHVAQGRAWWIECQAMPDGEEKAKRAEFLASEFSSAYDYRHPRPEEVTNAHVREKGSSLYTLLTLERNGYGKSITAAEACAVWFRRNPEASRVSIWLTHYRNRLAYENQMLEAQGGRAGEIEIEVGGWIVGTRSYHRRHGWRQIHKVNKSPVTGRVVSVAVKMPDDRYGNTSEGFHIANIEIERASPDCYRAPTDEERTAFAAQVKAEKAAKKASKPPAPPLINPTDTDAERLVEMWNKARREKHEAANTYKSESARAMHTAQFKPCEVRRITQAVYSANSKGSYAKAETRAICSLGRLEERSAFYDYSGQAQRALERGPALCEIRTTGFDPVHVIILTDKPQKPLPAAVWLPREPAADALVLSYTE